MNIVAAILSLVVLCMLAAPFFIGAGGLLAPAAQINAPEKLEALVKALLQRYLDDEEAHARGDLSPFAWRQRKVFLVNRYVDAVRRLDFVRGGASQNRVSAQVSSGDAT